MVKVLYHSVLHFLVVVQEGKHSRGRETEREKAVAMSAFWRWAKIGRKGKRSFTPAQEANPEPASIR